MEMHQIDMETIKEDNQEQKKKTNTKSSMDSSTVEILLEKFGKTYYRAGAKDRAGLLKEIESFLKSSGKDFTVIEIGNKFFGLRRSYSNYKKAKENGNTDKIKWKYYAIMDKILGSGKLRKRTPKNSWMRKETSGETCKMEIKLEPDVEITELDRPQYQEYQDVGNFDNSATSSINMSQNIGWFNQQQAPVPWAHSNFVRYNNHPDNVAPQRKQIFSQQTSSTPAPNFGFQPLTSNFTQNVAGASNLSLAPDNKSVILKLLNDLINIQNQRTELDGQRMKLESEKSALETRICNLDALVSAVLFQTLQAMLTYNIDQ